jgi:hypothetical protein
MVAIDVDVEKAVVGADLNKSTIRFCANKDDILRSGEC